MGNGRVLIVEDEADLAWVEQFNLEEEGYEVRVAGDGNAALKLLAEFDPDVLVLDVMLPQMDGWSILAKMQELPGKRHPKVILVSAVAGAQQHAHADVVRSFLAKPFDMEDLVKVVGEVLAAA